jgi:hypothetical protein
MPKNGKKNPYADPEKAEDVIQAEFGHRLEKKEQPEWIEGGKMFDYQLEGMKYVLADLLTVVGCIFSGTNRPVRFWRMRWGWVRRREDSYIRENNPDNCHDYNDFQGA